MAAACIDAVDGDTPTVLDPACGTGVFLRAALGALRRRYPKKDAELLASKCLFGVDIDPWALEASAFVLMADVWTGDRPPVAVWRRLRCNLACTDTLRVDPAQTKQSSAIGRISVSRLFPTLDRAPTIVLGNPPYADL